MFDPATGTDAGNTRNLLAINNVFNSLKTETAFLLNPTPSLTPQHSPCATVDSFGGVHSGD